MKIKIQRLSERAILPAYAHSAEEDAGLDLHALEDATLEPGIPRLVPTGLVQLPQEADDGTAGRPPVHTRVST